MSTFQTDTIYQLLEGRVVIDIKDGRPDGNIIIKFDDGIWLFVRDAGLWKRDTDESREIGEHTLPLLDKIRAWATQYTNRHKA